MEKKRAWYIGFALGVLWVVGKTTVTSIPTAVRFSKQVMVRGKWVWALLGVASISLLLKKKHDAPLEARREEYIRNEVALYTAAFLDKIRAQKFVKLLNAGVTPERALWLVQNVTPA